MALRRRLMMAEESDENFWPSFTDLTSTIALILFVLILLAYIQNLISGKKLAYIEAQLDDTHQRLETSKAEISRSERNLRLLEADLKKTTAEIEAGQIRLKLSEEKVDDQKQVIAESNQELGDLRAKLSGVAVLRVEVLEKVKRLLEAELKDRRTTNAPVVQIADNGNIVINESLVFEYNSFTIKKEGKQLLNTLATAFANLLTDGDVRANIDVVTVQGHTDERGSTTYNRELSSKRANAVLDHMFKVNTTLEQDYGSFFAASAYSEFRPVATDASESAYEKNRRIEISVVLKDANIRNVINDYLKNINPILHRRSNPPRPAPRPTGPPLPPRPAQPTQPAQINGDSI